MIIARLLAGKNPAATFQIQFERRPRSIKWPVSSRKKIVGWVEIRTPDVGFRSSTQPTKIA
ncbi:hypothetical protein D1AOALGA4SA_1715 [Olavius algarvensis Delta 1 endosymbiont]|nr:hypothetical protein D1AOALGA4SA_1715 [Olavius algarvensis Delta 1 endosymbiont]